ncbi:uncharacterized protein LAJ45_09944 [Morchella importuna]|nr:uncharacterized protein LAJ45_09944 [Morchella importuna]KAH8146022.1 hypothetical protein LAJ45_09944 [Morchella importuna]
MDPSKTQTPLPSTLDPSKTQTPLPSTLDPSKTQTPLPLTMDPPSYDSEFPIPVSSDTPASYTPAPYSPETINPSANTYDHNYDAPIPVETLSQSASEFVPEQRPRIDSHGSSQYLHAVPLHTLTRAPAPVDCPICNKRGMTKCAKKSGNFTHMCAAVTCAVSCLGCIPYLISSLKDVKHSCTSCGVLLAVWHRSGGGTDVLAHALK